MGFLTLPVDTASGELTSLKTYPTTAYLTTTTNQNIPELDLIYLKFNPDYGIKYSDRKKCNLR